jgi:ABC-type multidrug transport system ATPase subunit
MGLIIGCGKTSLMNILAARVSGLVEKNTKLTGTIKVNGVEREDELFRRVSAYVLQDDRLYPHLTVQETLMMSAHFFLPEDYDINQKSLLVDSVIAELGLGKARNTIIGDEKVRGVSGGERKRANIAVQLISNPAILFLDEPTSGLDSFQAQAVMESMKAMTEHGRLVITVIHQPRSSIFEMFDKLLLLSEGRVVYMGDARAASKYFGKIGFPPPKFFNPADYFLDILSPDSRSHTLESESSKRIVELSNIWDTNLDTTASILGRVDQDPIDSLLIPASWSFSKWQQNTKLLFWRSWTELLRNKVEIFFKLIMSCIFSGIIGGMYSGIGYDQGSIYNR